MRHSTARRSGSPVLLYVVLALALTSALGPVLWAVGSSFKTSHDILTDAFGLPLPPSFQGYVDTTQQIDLHLNILNTFVYAASAAVLCSVLGLLLAYPLTRLDIPGRNALTVLITSGIAVPAICLITPEFFIMLRAGLLDTKIGLVIFYTAIFLPLAFIILRSFLLSVPTEVEEAAALDGAGYLRTVFTVVAPLVVPAIATVAILVFINVWNDFLWNLLLAPGQAHRNTQVALASLRGQFEFNVAAVLAGATIVLVVPVLLFLLTQRYALAGLTGGVAPGRRR